MAEHTLSWIRFIVRTFLFSQVFHQQKAPLAPYVFFLPFSCEPASFISSAALCICPLAATRASFINAMPLVDYSPSYVKAFKYSSGSDFLHFLTFLAALTALWNLLQSILCSVSEPIGLSQASLRDNGQCFRASGVVNNRSVGQTSSSLYRSLFTIWLAAWRKDGFGVEKKTTTNDDDTTEAYFHSRSLCKDCRDAV